MRVALISDLHGNPVALDSVLVDIARRGHDRIVCLGDVATLGAQPNDLLARLAGLGCTCIMGNHDEFLLDDQLIRTYTEVPVVVEAVDWCRARMGGDELAFVATFEREASIAMSDTVKLLVFHGSPRSHMENILATTPADDLERFLDGRVANVMAGGHTHLQMVRQHRGTWLVNPGSVAMPFREFAFGQAPTLMDHAEYATVEASATGVSITTHKVAVDKRALRVALDGTTNPLADMLRTQL